MYRNADLVALAVIVMFGATGTAVVNRLSEVRWERVMPLVHDTRPRVVEIREEMRQVQREVGPHLRDHAQQLRRELQQTRDELRRTLRNQAQLSVE